MNPYRRWSILLLGSHGQIIQLHRFKLMFWVLAIIFLAALGSAGYFYHRYRVQTRAFDEVALQVETLEQSLAALRKEREVRIEPASPAGKGSPSVPGAVAEDQPAADQEGEPAGYPPVSEPDESDAHQLAAIPAPPAVPGNNPAQDGPGNTGAAEASGQGLPETAPAAEARPPDLPGESPPTVRRAAVSQFKSTPLPEAGQLKIAYRITNELRSQGKLKGYTYVLLEGDVDGVDHFVVVPDGLAASIRPPLQPHGYDFAVLNYLTIRLTAQGIQDYGWIRRATVYVCDSDGTLLLQEAVPLSVS